MSMDGVKIRGRFSRALIPINSWATYKLPTGLDQISPSLNQRERRSPAGQSRSPMESREQTGEANAIQPHVFASRQLHRIIRP
jgi:hypothetical protein